MDNVETLLTTTMKEIEHILSTKTVVGEIITIGDTKIIPLINLGFGFGAGGGSGKGKMPGSDDCGEGEGGGAGTGGGGGVKPVAMIIVDQNGVRVESVKGSASSALEAIGTTISNAFLAQKTGKTEH